MMKRQRLLALVSLLVMAMAVWANPISKESARQKAQAFLTEQLAAKGLRSGARPVTLTQVEEASTTLYGDKLYLFNAADGNGFVIMSGDDRLEPVLGYATSGSIDMDNLPVNLRSWLQHYADEIEYMEREGISATRVTATDCGAAIESQLTSRWNQNPVYNKQCPQVRIYADEACTELLPYGEDGSTNALLPVTGCVATALAQVLYQWKSVPATLTDIPARDFVWQDQVTVESYGTVGTPMWIKFSDVAIPAGTTIDWANMLDDYFEYNAEGKAIGVLGTEAQQDAVANLMHICGAAVDMQYGVYFGTGSQAFTYKALLAAYNVFGFKNVSYCVQENYGYQDWLQRLYDEVKVAKAVMFAGQSKGGGHAFVIDGYDKEDFFHVNWGWGGVCDGMYRMNSMQPIEQGAGGAVGDDNGFRMMQSFLTGLYPDAPSPKQELRVDMFRAVRETVIEPENGKFVLPDITCEVQNVSIPTIKLKLGVAIADGNNIENLQLSDDFQELDFDGRLNKDGLQLTLNSTLPDGEYLILPTYCTDVQDWNLCARALENYVKLTKVGNQMMVENVTPFELEVVEADNAETYEAGVPFEVKATLKVKKGSLHETLSGVYFRQGASEDDYESTYDLEIYYKEAGDTFDFTFTFPNGLSEGTYTLMLYTTSVFAGEVCHFTVTPGTGIKDMKDETLNMKHYNLQGQRVGEGYKGLVIQQGKKYLKK